MITCASKICINDDAYCCLDDNGDWTCCTSNNYYQTWWFWFMWGMFLLIIVSCSIACYQSCNRRQRMRYMVLGQSEQPVYGTVVTGPSPGNPYTVHPAPSAPMAPPAYTYPQEKPPAYTPAQP